MLWYTTFMSVDVSAILKELLGRFERNMTPEFARMFAKWELSEETESRLDDLSEKANEGTLTPEENAELGALIEMCDRLSILKMRSELLLKKAGSAA